MNTEDEGTIICRILRECANPVIFDLGAYGGEDTAWLAGACTSPPIIVAIEADHENFRRLYNSLPRALALYEGAISNSNGSCTFYECHTGLGRGSGSIRKPTGHVDRGGVHYDFRPVTVKCWTLDYIFAETKVDHIDLIWCDIQGAEPNMIAGGQNALAHARYLFIEAEDDSTPEMYEGQLMRTKLLELLPGWEQVQRFDFNTLLRNKSLT